MATSKAQEKQAKKDAKALRLRNKNDKKGRADAKRLKGRVQTLENEQEVQQSQNRAVQKEEVQEERVDDLASILNPLNTNAVQVTQIVAGTDRFDIQFAQRMTLKNTKLLEKFTKSTEVIAENTKKMYKQDNKIKKYSKSALETTTLAPSGIGNCDCNEKMEASLLDKIAGVLGLVGVAGAMAWKKIKEYASKAWKKAKDLAKKAWNGIKKAVKSAWKYVKTGASKLWDKGKDIVKGAAQKVFQYAKKGFETLKGYAVKGVNAVKGMIPNRVKKVLGRLLKKLAIRTMAVGAGVGVSAVIGGFSLPILVIVAEIVGIAVGIYMTVDLVVDLAVMSGLISEEQGNNIMGLINAIPARMWDLFKKKDYKAYAIEKDLKEMETLGNELDKIRADLHKAEDADKKKEAMKLRRKLLARDTRYNKYADQFGSPHYVSTIGYENAGWYVFFYSPKSKTDIAKAEKEWYQTQIVTATKESKATNEELRKHKELNEIKYNKQMSQKEKSDQRQVEYETEMEIKRNKLLYAIKTGSPGSASNLANYWLRRNKETAILKSNGWTSTGASPTTGTSGVPFRYDGPLGGKSIAHIGGNYDSRDYSGTGAVATGNRWVTYPNGMTKKNGSKSWRNNNPGNITGMGGKLLFGAIGFALSKTGDKGDQNQLVFISVEAGFNAMRALIAKKYCNGPIIEEFYKYQTDKVSFYNKINDVRKHGIDTNATFCSLPKEQQEGFLKIWAKWEGYTKGQIHQNGNGVDNQKSGTAYTGNQRNQNSNNQGIGPRNPYYGMSKSDASKIMSGAQSNSGGSGAADFAKSWADRGIAYGWGAGRSVSAQMNGSTSYDCSSFVAMIVGKTYGIPISKFGGVVVDQWKYMRSGGVPVRYDEAEAGDILFMWTVKGSSAPSHVGIAIGNGNMVHASGGSTRGGYKAGNTGVITAKMFKQSITRVFRLKGQGNASVSQNFTTPTYSSIAQNPVASTLNAVMTPQAAILQQKKTIEVVNQKADAALKNSTKSSVAPQSKIVPGTPRLSNTVSMNE